MNKKDKESLDKLLESYDPKAEGLIKYKNWKKKYNEELIDFSYVQTLEEFKTLSLGGVIKVITLSNEELKKGGIVVKIDKDQKNKWFALLSVPKMRYIWKINFDNNYVFYRRPYNVYISDDSTEAFKNIMDKFVNKDEIALYTEHTERDDELQKMFDRYKK